jgi:hypothetical protein
MLPYNYTYTSYNSKLMLPYSYTYTSYNSKLMLPYSYTYTNHNSKLMLPYSYTYTSYNSKLMLPYSYTYTSYNCKLMLPYSYTCTSYNSKLMLPYSYTYTNYNSKLMLPYSYTYTNYNSKAMLSYSYTYTNYNSNIMLPPISTNTNAAPLQYFPTTPSAARSIQSSSLRSTLQTFKNYPLSPSYFCQKDEQALLIGSYSLYTPCLRSTAKSISDLRPIITQRFLNTRVRTEVSPCGIYGEQSSSVARILTSISVCYYPYHSTTAA